MSQTSRVILGIVFVLVFSIALASSASAEDVAYVIKSNSFSDQNIISVLNELGYSYDVIVENQIPSTDFSEYRLVLVGDTTFGSAYVEELKDVLTEHNSVIVNSKYYYQSGSDKRWGWSKDLGQITRSILDLNNNKNNISITDGLPESFTAYDERAISAYKLSGQKPTGIKIVTFLGNLVNGDYVVAYVEKNTTMLNGRVTSGRSLFFGLTESQYWTEDTRDLFRNSVDWAIKGQDRDGDGFFDNDCNDDNPLINPNGTEIPYDGIDQDCNGRDFADLDGDGFDSTIVGGNDCDDSDALININSTDKLKNCINDAPELNEDIPDFTWQEDTELEVDLNGYFTDPESGNVTFYIVDQSSENVNIIYDFTEKIFRIIPLDNWFGSLFVRFGASDGVNNVEGNLITLDVMPVNDAPLLEEVDDVYVVAGHTVSVMNLLSATDTEGDDLEYTFSSPLNDQGVWETEEGDEGIYPVSVSVSDGDDSDTKEFNIIVMSLALINEISNTDGGWVELYNTGDIEFNLDQCSFDVNNETVNLEGVIENGDFRVIELSSIFSANGEIKLLCNGEIVDELTYGDEEVPSLNSTGSIGRSEDGADNWKAFNSGEETKGISNTADIQAPVVSLTSPANGNISNVRNIDFRFGVSDNSESLRCSLIINSESFGSVDINLVNGSSSGVIPTDSLGDGNYLWNVKCDDSRNSGFSNENRTIVISAPDAPVLDNINDISVSENESVTFTISGSDQDGDIKRFYAEDLPSGAVFNGSTFSWTPNFNQSGSYQVKFFVEDNTGRKDSKIVNINVGNFILPPDFNDAKKCEAKNSSIVLDLDDPRENEKFEIGETISVEGSIRNNLEDDEEFKVTAYIYDLSEDEELENSKVSVDIDEGDREDFELELEIPSDIDEDNDFAVYVYVEGDGQCNTDYRIIRVERVDDAVEINKFESQPVEVQAGEEVIFDVKLENVGADDQDDVYFTLKNSDLNLNLKSDLMDLEKFGDDDSAVKKISFIIPKNTSARDYSVIATVFFNGETVTSSKTLRVIPSTQPVVTGSKSGTTNTYTYVQEGSNTGSTNTYPVTSNGNTVTYTISNNAGEAVTRPVESSGINSSTTRVESLGLIRLGEEDKKTRVYYEEDGAVMYKEKESNSDAIQRASEYLKDSKISNLVIVLDALLFIGIIISIIKLIIYFKKR